MRESYSIGDAFQRKSQAMGKEDIYIIACVGRDRACALISLGGDRWKDPITVNNLSSISREEFSLMGGGLMGLEPIEMLSMDVLRKAKVKITL